MAASASELEAAQAAMKARQERDRNKRRVETRRRNQEMQASVTTLNIMGPTIEQAQAEDTAEVLYTPETAPVEETVTVKASELASLQAQLDELKGVKQIAGGMSFEQLAYFIQEMKKPDEETQAKLAAEKARKQKERDEMVAMAIAEDESIRLRQTNCSHKKENGRTAIVPAGQMPDGMYQYLCQHCQKVMPPTRLNPDQYGVQSNGPMVFA